MSLENYINALKNEYDGISYVLKEREREYQNIIPVQLKELYNKYDYIEFPFGTIYSVEQSIEMSSRLPFREGQWFCFGQDFYFSYWLCKMDTAKDNPAFSIWDHEMDHFIEEPFFQTLEEVLDYVAEEYNSSELDDECNVVVTKCDEKGLKELMQVKKLFSSQMSISKIKQEVSEGSCIIRGHINKYEARKILSSYTFRHIKIVIEELS